MDGSSQGAGAALALRAPRKAEAAAVAIGKNERLELNVSGIATTHQANRMRLREIRHRHGLLATGDTPPAPPRQDWLTARQRALLGQSPFVNEAALLALRRKEDYLKDKEAEYTERAQELTRRIKAAQRFEIDGWEGADGLNVSQAAVLRRCVEELAEVDQQLASVNARLSEIAAEEDSLHLLLKGPPPLDPEEERRIRQRLVDLQAERQLLEERKRHYMQRQDALRKMIGQLKSDHAPDGDELDLQLRLSLFGLRKFPDRFPWETEPAWLAVQFPEWSYRLAEDTGLHVPKAIPEDPTALAHARIASYQKARQCCMDLAQAAASVAHEAVQADLIDDWEAASILYRKATVLLEQAAEEVTSEQSPLGGVHELTGLAKQWVTKARVYWARADLLSGQGDLDNLFFMLDADGDGTISFREFKDGFGYMEERLSRLANPTAPHQQRFERSTDRWSVLDVARWLEEEVEVGQVASAFVAGRVDGVLLRELDEDDLAELGVNSGIVRKKILLALAQLSDATYDGVGWTDWSNKGTGTADAATATHSTYRTKSGAMRQHGGPSAVSSSDDDSDG